MYCCWTSQQPSPTNSRPTSWGSMPARTLCLTGLSAYTTRTAMSSASHMPTAGEQPRLLETALAPPNPLQRVYGKVACMNAPHWFTVARHIKHPEMSEVVLTLSFYGCGFSKVVRQLSDHCLVLQRQHLHRLCGPEVPKWRGPAHQCHPPAGLAPPPHPSPKLLPTPQPSPLQACCLACKPHILRLPLPWYHACCTQMQGPVVSGW